jgi:hypothetical protein
MKVDTVLLLMIFGRFMNPEYLCQNLFKIFLSWRTIKKCISFSLKEIDTVLLSFSISTMFNQLIIYNVFLILGQNVNAICPVTSLLNVPLQNISLNPPSNKMWDR